MGTVLVIVIVVGIFALAIRSMTDKGQAERRELLENREKRKQAVIDAHRRELTATGSGWTLEVASWEKVETTPLRDMGWTHVTVRNDSDAPRSFRVDLVVRDEDQVRIGELSAMTGKLDPGERQVIKLVGSLAVRSTRKYGKLDYKVVAYTS